jgi:hypothetical protein
MGMFSVVGWEHQWPASHRAHYWPKKAAEVASPAALVEAITRLGDFLKTEGRRT